MYDYFLGGSHNFAADRAAAEQILEIFPDTGVAAQTNRHFLRRAVRLRRRAGRTPVPGHRRRAAHPGQRARGRPGRSHPDARVVYVDYDEVAVAYARRLLPDGPAPRSCGATCAGPDDLLAHPDVRATIDLDRPVAVLLVAVLHFVTGRRRPVGGRRPAARRHRARQPPGAVPPDAGRRPAAAGRARARRSTGSSSAPLVPRTHADDAALLRRVRPGRARLVRTADWRPDGEPRAGFRTATPGWASAADALSPPAAGFGWYDGRSACHRRRKRRWRAGPSGCFGEGTRRSAPPSWSCSSTWRSSSPSASWPSTCSTTSPWAGRCAPPCCLSVSGGSGCPPPGRPTGTTRTPRPSERCWSPPRWAACWPGWRSRRGCTNGRGSSPARTSRSISSGAWSPSRCCAVIRVNVGRCESSAGTASPPCRGWPACSCRSGGCRSGRSPSRSTCPAHGSAGRRR